MPFSGEFVEDKSDFHQAARQRLLKESDRPKYKEAKKLSADAHDSIKANLLEQLVDDQIAIIELDKPVSQEFLLTLANDLGVPMPETANELSAYIEEDVFLHIIGNHKYDGKAEYQPFSEQYLTLHTECSGRLLKDQPRFILFFCLASGNPANRAYTILTPMHKVLEQLSRNEQDILAVCRYENESFQTPFILQQDAGHSFLVFRDFHPFDRPMRWRCEGDAYSATQVNDAFKSLLTAMYNYDNSRFITWQENMLVAFNNRAFFHGKTHALGDLDHDGEYRHLLRLRIRNHDW